MSNTQGTSWHKLIFVMRNLAAKSHICIPRNIVKRKKWVLELWSGHRSSQSSSFPLRTFLGGSRFWIGPHIIIEEAIMFSCWQVTLCPSYMISSCLIVGRTPQTLWRPSTHLESCNRRYDNHSQENPMVMFRAHHAFTIHSTACLCFCGVIYSLKAIDYFVCPLIIGWTVVESNGQWGDYSQQLFLFLVV